VRREEILVGADLVEIGRLAAALARRPRLRERVFTPAEIAYCQRKSDPVPSLAARFAAKEAVGKLLQTGVLSWREIEVRMPDEGSGARMAGGKREDIGSGAPVVRLSGRTEIAAAGLGVGNISLTLTHTTFAAAAVAVARTIDGWRSEEEGGSRPGTGLRDMSEHQITRPGILRGLAEGLPGFTAVQMRELDRIAVEEMGIPGAVLMERAALGVVEAVLERYPGWHTLVLCGKGNNGGDGLAAARLLHLAGHPVVCAVAADDASTLSPDAAANLRSAERAGVNLLMELPPAYLWEETDLVVDCLLGTGATGEIRDPLNEWTGLVNDAGGKGIPVLAVDIPSGVDATTGRVAGDAVVADLTVTFHSCKSGLLCPPGSEAAGEVLAWEIGIPRESEPQPDMQVVAARDVHIPRRQVDDHKYSVGTVTVIGGSDSYPGAAYLAARAAARAGAGYVRVVVPAGVGHILKEKLSQEVVVPVGSGGSLSDLDGLREALDDGRADSLVLGPGLGGDWATAEVVRGLLAGSTSLPPTVLDADGLVAFAGRMGELRHHPALVLTPHVGELARLLDTEVSRVRECHLEAVRQAVETSGQVVVLKGSNTLIAGPDGILRVVVQGPPQLAGAGTGDVLSGLIGTMLARGLSPMEAACSAVWIHAEAGRYLAGAQPQGILAEDLIDVVPRIMVDRMTLRS